MGGSNQDAAVSSFCTAASYDSGELRPQLLRHGEAMLHPLALDIPAAGQGHKQPLFALDNPHILHQKTVIQDHTAHRPQFVGTGKSLFDFRFELH
jgi:hypothetical protein